MAAGEDDDYEEDTIHTPHLTLNVLNMITNMGGVPLVWGVCLLGSSMLLAVIGFITTNSGWGLLFALPTMLTFYIIKFICINSLDSLRVFQLKFAGKWEKLKHGGGVYKLTPLLDEDSRGDDVYEQIKRAKHQ
ncbi:conjugal transfer protein TraD [Erwinia amylovora]|uniref:conjugal transfer protein TraD n=1 Tax=Erwinia amylovora TaxID=552 RepID=UPI0020C13FD6|nr:conjugal transfer protein TraD [Erwinia amylovora]MCK8336016.1 conjugal transfer protein TraD [Erwinia amylovora]